MGGACCKTATEELAEFGRVKSFRRPKWRSEDPVTAEELQQMREEFWETEPHYGGDRVIWDALKAACGADMETAKIIIESAGIIVASEDMTICYDERGGKYSLPNYVLSNPQNLVRGSLNSKRRDSGSVELVAGGNANMVMAR